MIFPASNHFSWRSMKIHFDTRKDCSSAILGFQGRRFPPRDIHFVHVLIVFARFPTWKLFLRAWIFLPNASLEAFREKWEFPCLRDLSRIELFPGENLSLTPRRHDRANRKLTSISKRPDAVNFLSRRRRAKSVKIDQVVGFLLQNDFPWRSKKSHVEAGKDCRSAILGF